MTNKKNGISNENKLFCHYLLLCSKKKSKENRKDFKNILPFVARQSVTFNNKTMA